MPGPDLSDDALNAWRALLVAHARTVTAIERDLAAAGTIPLGTYDVLLALRSAPERRLRMHELADAVVLSRSGLTRLVDRMHRRGLIAREPCPEDRRGQLAVLTEEGDRVLRETWPVYRAAIAANFASRIGDPDARRLAAILEPLGGAVAAR